MPGGVAVNHGDAWPAQGKGSGSGQKKKRSGAADLEIHQGILKRGSQDLRAAQYKPVAATTRPIAAGSSLPSYAVLRIP